MSSERNDRMMTTPKRVYDSDVYKSVAEGRQGDDVPLVWFQDVYEALGKAISEDCVHPWVALQVRNDKYYECSCGELLRR